MTADYLDRIAAFAVNLTFEDLPEEVIDRSCRLMLDAIAVTVAGAAEPRVRAAADMLRRRGSRGRSLFFTDGAGGDAADAAIDLRERHRLQAADIVRVTADTFAIPARDNVEQHPANVLAAKESFPVSLALTLVNGRCDQSVFTEAHVADPEVARLAAACEVRCDAELDAMAPEKRPSRITLSLRDGREVTAFEAVALGDPSKPLSPEALDAKFDELVAGRLGRERATRLKETVFALHSQPSLEPLAALLRPVT